MTPEQLRRRAALLGKSDAALDRFPQRTGREFVGELTEVAQGLAKLAQAADRAGGDALERSRTWRHLGNAYFDLGSGREKAQLERASAAFERAETLLAGVNDPVETVKLNYSWGQTLFQLCDATDARLASQARDRFATALALAPTHLPGGVSSLQKQLADAERVVGLLTEAEGLGRRIGQLESELRDTEPKPSRSQGAADIQALFGVLQHEFEKDKPNLEPTRREGLESFMGRLGKLVSGETEGGERSLEDMLANRGQLDSLIRELQPQGRKPSLKGPGAPAGSRSERLLAALQELKMFVFSAHVQPGAPAGLRAAALDLFPRIGRLTTWISEAGSDHAKVRQLESDQARGLANEVRMFARRAHVMLARPVWSRYRGLVDANRIFFSGPAALRQGVAGAAARLGLELDQPGRAGADVAEHRWQDLRAANVAVFDLSDGDPQVYYELGIALAVGTQLLLIAKEGMLVPFDVAQHVRVYAPTDGLETFLADEIDGAMYGLHVRGGGRSSLEATQGYAERLAAADSGNALLGVALRSVRNGGADPVKFSDALNVFNSYLGAAEQELLLPRWPGAYPDPRRPRSFAVMPFRQDQEPAYAVVAAAARKAGVEPVRGDVAEGQQIVESIWDEICRATHVTVDLTGLNLNVCLELGLAHTLGRPTLIIGRDGTERALGRALPGAAKWRCHTYPADPKTKPAFQATLSKFFGSKASP